MLKGSLVAIVSPMHADGSLDLPGLKRLIDWHIEHGTNGIVIVGTTGESPTVDVAEHELLIKTAVEHVAKRIPVIAGTGANSTKEAIELASYAKSVGADYHLSVVPYYNKPSQEGMYQHFKAIGEAVDLPMILYNVPGRTVVDLADETTLRLAQIKNIVGIKDATGNLQRAQDLIKRAPKDFVLLTGDDATTCAYILLGGHGTISVTANIAPKAMSQMCAAALAGDRMNAIRIDQTLQDLHRHLFMEPSPTPAKWALQRLGKIQGGIRLPLLPLTEKSQPVIESAMKTAGVL
jgi:4-hydroxy-tetrahydrodipicolinate synthase